MKHTVYSYVITNDDLSEISGVFVNGILKYEGKICEFLHTIDKSLIKTITVPQAHGLLAFYLKENALQITHNTGARSLHERNTKFIG